MIWRVITDFGDSALLAPMAAIILLWLAANRWWYSAACWCLVMPAAIAAVVATKIAFMGWGIGIDSLDFTGISGHSTLGTAVLPVALYLTVARFSRPIGWLAAFAGLMWGIAIGMSRLVLQYHSASEVVAGCLLGGLTAITMVALFGGEMRRKPLLPMPILVVALLMLTSTVHGERAGSEGIIMRLALAVSGHAVPYVRGHAPSPNLFAAVPADAPL